jgi:hypothetical protein
MGNNFTSRESSSRIKLARRKKVKVSITLVFPRYFVLTCIRTKGKPIRIPVIKYEILMAIKSGGFPKNKKQIPIEMQITKNTCHHF